MLSGVSTCRLDAMTLRSDANETIHHINMTAVPMSHTHERMVSQLMPEGVSAGFSVCMGGMWRLSFCRLMASMLPTGVVTDDAVVL